jgi:hypothetical protein
MNLALGDFSMVESADMPWAPLADLRDDRDLMALVKIIEHQWGTAARRMTGTGSQRVEDQLLVST